MGRLTGKTVSLPRLSILNADHVLDNADLCGVVPRRNESRSEQAASRHPGNKVTAQCQYTSWPYYNREFNVSRHYPRALKASRLRNFSTKFLA